MAQVACISTQTLHLPPQLLPPPPPPPHLFPVSVPTLPLILFCAHFLFVILKGIILSSMIIPHYSRVFALLHNLNVLSWNIDREVGYYDYG